MYQVLNIRAWIPSSVSTYFMQILFTDRSRPTKLNLRNGASTYRSTPTPHSPTSPQSVWNLHNCAAAFIDRHGVNDPARDEDERYASGLMPRGVFGGGRCLRQYGLRLLSDGWKGRCRRKRLLPDTAAAPTEEAFLNAEVVSSHFYEWPRALLQLALGEFGFDRTRVAFAEVPPVPGAGFGGIRPACQPQPGFEVDSAGANKPLDFPVKMLHSFVTALRAWQIGGGSLHLRFRPFPRIRECRRRLREASSTAMRPRAPRRGMSRWEIMKRNAIPKRVRMVYPVNKGKPPQQFARLFSTHQWRAAWREPDGRSRRLPEQSRSFPGRASLRPR